MKTNESQGTQAQVPGLLSPASLGTQAQVPGLPSLDCIARIALPGLHSNDRIA